MARPSKFSRSTIDRLLESIRLGATYEHACMYAGISYDTFNDWRNGRFPKRLTADQRQLRDELPDALKEAEGANVRRCLELILASAQNGDWRPAAWILERRYPAHYGKNLNVQLEIQTHQIVEDIAQEDGLTDEEKRELHESVAQFINTGQSS